MHVYEGDLCVCLYSQFLNSFSVPESALLVTYISVAVSGDSAYVCVETDDAASVKLILMDATKRRHITNSEK